MKFSDYIPVDVDRLRPAQSYRDMMHIRRVREDRFLGPDGRVKSELVEQVVCLVCGANESQPLFVKEGFDFVECVACSLVYVNPQLRSDAVREVYEDQSMTSIIRDLVASSNDYRKERFGSERMDIIERFASKVPGRMLDIGCTTGFFLEAAQERGWSAAGVEANPYAAAVAIDKGLDVQNAMIEDAALDPACFDAIAIFDVIEHVRDPMAMLEKAGSLLRSGGVLLVYTPNWDCAERFFMGEASHFIWGTHHLSYFTAQTLGLALERAGFQVEWHETRGLDFEDSLWYFEEHGTYDMEFVKRFRHELQFLADAAGYGKNLRMIGRRP